MHLLSFLLTIVLLSMAHSRHRPPLTWEQINRTVEKMANEDNYGSISYSCKVAQVISMIDCSHGLHQNENCQNRQQCYQGPEEFCTEHFADNTMGLTCEPSLYYCHSIEHKCVGGDYDVNTNKILTYNSFSNGKREPFKMWFA